MGLRSKIRDRKEFTEDTYWADAVAELAAEPAPTLADIEPPPVAHRTAQTLYGPDVRRCPVVGCGAHTTGDVCVQCSAAGRIPAHDDEAPFHRSSFLTEAILDGEEDDLPTLDECGPNAAAMVGYLIEEPS